MTNHEHQHQDDPLDGGDVVYHGHRHERGVVIDIETPDGQILGRVVHVVRHSPTGMNWGYAGSGPADCARSLLLAALGPDAVCATCRGAAKVVYDPDLLGDVPYDPARGTGYDPDLVWACPDCDNGHRRVPYQQFKTDHVAHWGEQWRMPRSQIRTWLTSHTQQTD